jgi:hypothetical protein
VDLLAQKPTTENASNRSNHPAVKTLRQFFTAMNNWEWLMIREDFSDLEQLDEKHAGAEIAKRNDASRKKLASIFKRYCEAGVRARRVRDLLHSGGEEPDYNPRTEKILSVEDRGDTVVIETKMSHNFKFNLRYEMVRKGGKWLIRDNRKCKSDFHPKWSRWDL